MYSRNFGTFENITASKQNPHSKDSYIQKDVRIPVKSFSDNSAFERFNNLGNAKNIAEDGKENNNETESQILREHKEQNTDEFDNNEQSYENNTGQANTKTDIQTNKKSIQPDDKKTLSFPLDIKSLSGIFDSDFLLIALAIAMLIFGNNETNDKLTPIALLAIMFL